MATRATASSSGAAPEQIRTGAESGAEMGAFGVLKQPQRKRISRRPRRVPALRPRGRALHRDLKSMGPRGCHERRTSRDTFDRAQHNSAVRCRRAASSPTRLERTGRSGALPRRAPGSRPDRRVRRADRRGRFALVTEPNALAVHAVPPTARGSSPRTARCSRPDSGADRSRVDQRTSAAPARDRAGRAAPAGRSATAAPGAPPDQPGNELEHAGRRHAARIAPSRWSMPTMRGRSATAASWSGRGTAARRWTLKTDHGAPLRGALHRETPRPGGRPGRRDRRHEGRRQRPGAASRAARASTCARSRGFGTRHGWAAATAAHPAQR